MKEKNLVIIDKPQLNDNSKIVVQALDGEIHINAQETFDDYLTKLSNQIRDEINTVKYSAHYYKSSEIKFLGREAEMKELSDFCLAEEQIRWLAVTGVGGIGKSRLVYEFVKNNLDNSDWRFSYLKWDEYSATDLISTTNYDVSINSVIILDYFVAFSMQVGKLMKSIKQLIGASSKKVRFILIERENSKNSAWMDGLLSSAKTELKQLAWNKMIELGELDNTQMSNIVKEYYLKLSNKEVNRKQLRKIFSISKKIDNDMERLSTILLITEAFAANGKVSFNDLESINEWWNKNEHSRILQIVNSNHKVCTAFEEILCLSTIINGISIEDIVENLPKQYSIIREFVQENGKSIKELLNSINIVHDQEELYVYPVKPDILGELFVLKHLEKTKLDNGDVKGLHTLAQLAWNINNIRYHGFIERIFYDYPENIMLSFKYLLSPEEVEVIIKSDLKKSVNYAQMLLNITYSTQNNETRKIALEKLGLIYNAIKDETISEYYCMALVNMTKFDHNYSMNNDIIRILKTISNIDTSFYIANAITNYCIFVSVPDKFKLIDEIKCIVISNENDGEIELQYISCLWNCLLGTKDVKIKMTYICSLCEFVASRKRFILKTTLEMYSRILVEDILSLDILTIRYIMSTYFKSFDYDYFYDDNIEEYFMALDKYVMIFPTIMFNFMQFKKMFELMQKIEASNRSSFIVNFVCNLIENLSVDVTDEGIVEEAHMWCMTIDDWIEKSEYTVMYKKDAYLAILQCEYALLLHFQIPIDLKRDILNHIKKNYEKYPYNDDYKISYTGSLAKVICDLEEGIEKDLLIKEFKSISFNQKKYINAYYDQYAFIMY
ncbi:MAG: ATP-binding protein [bacterium]|nr:ATP-binding protein [bacterium]